jgi:transposase
MLQPLKLNAMYSSTNLKETVKGTNELFVGLDIHKDSWSVCIRTQELEHRCYRQKGDPEELHRYLEKHFREYRVKAGYEAGCMGFWIKRSLESFGYECMVLNAADIPGSDKEEKRKSDRSDCRKIARELSKGQLREVYCPALEQESFRSLFRQREALVIDLRKIKGRIRSLLMCYGVECPAVYQGNCWSRAFRRWLQELPLSQTTLRQSLESMLRRLDFLRSEKLGLELTLRKYVKSHYQDHYKLLMSVPGIGPVVAQAVLAEIGDVNRFRRIDELCSYIGLVPNIYQSGETCIVKGLTRRSHRLLRSYLVEAAWVVARKDPEMMAYYKKFSGRIISKKIIVKVARKLVTRMYYCLKTSQPYRLNYNQPVPVA